MRATPSRQSACRYCPCPNPGHMCTVIHCEDVTYLRKVNLGFCKTGIGEVEERPERERGSHVPTSRRQ